MACVTSISPFVLYTEGYNKLDQEKEQLVVLVFYPFRKFVLKMIKLICICSAKLLA